MSLYAKFQSQIADLPERESYSRADLLRSSFLLGEEKPLQVFYAPLEWVNRGAQIVVLGITPGWTQMERAYRVARREILLGRSAPVVMQAAKSSAAFAGALRRNLVNMLDGIGVAELLDIASSEELFEARRDLLHTTSLVRYPTFVAGKNYTGSSPPVVGSELLMSFVQEELVGELRRLPDAVIVPCGRAVEAVLVELGDRELVSTERVLWGFPHPSGANGHRLRAFAKNEQKLRSQLRGLGR